jgi:hypothetical protein
MMEVLQYFEESGLPRLRAKVLKITQPKLNDVLEGKNAPSTGWFRRWQKPDGMCPLPFRMPHKY